MYAFDFQRFEKELNWEVRFYNYDEAADPMQDYASFKALKNNPAIKTEQKTDLYYAWWGSPGEGVAADQFATFSSTTFEMEPGNYRIALTSDDGAKLFLDDELLIDHWDIHEPATDVIEVALGGFHRIEMEHFENGGFGTLDFRIEKIP